MNSRERLKAMVSNQPVDRVGITGWLHMPLVDRNPKDFAKASISFTEANGWDFVKVMYNGFYMTEAYGGDITYSKDPKIWYGEINKYPINHPNDLLNLPVLDPTKGVLAREIDGTKRIIDHFKGTVPVLATLFTPLTWIQEMTTRSRPEPTQAFMRYNQKELHRALEAVSETNIRFLEELVKAGIDGIFYATQFGTADYITPEEHREFGEKYDLPALEAIKDHTWFNMFHIHYYRNLMFEAFAKYPVQALNWEDKRGSDTERTSIRKARSLTDKVLICGIDEHHDFFNADNDREAIKAVLKERLVTSLKECGDNKFIFGPGCAMPIHNVDRYVFTLIQEVVDDYYSGQ